MARVSLHSLLQGAPLQQYTSPLALERPYLAWAIGATVTVKDRETLANVTVYAAETGGATLANPITIDDETPDGWVESGPRLRLLVGVPGGSSVPFDVEAVSATLHAEVPPIKDRLTVLESGRGTELRLRASGIAADGTDQYASLQALINVAISEGIPRVVHEGGTIRCDSPLSLGGPSGAVALHLAQPESLLDFSNAPVGATLITAAGSEEAAGTRPLTVDAAPSATVLTVGAGFEAGLSAGDRVRVASQRLYADNPQSVGISGVDQYIGEWAIVESVASGSITLENPLEEERGYAVADSAWVAKGTFVAAPKVTGRGKIIGGGDAKAHTAMSVSRCEDAEVTGIRIGGCPANGIRFLDVLHGTVDRVRGEAGTHTQELAYGVQFAYASSDCTLSNSYFRGYREGATCSGGTATSRPGINRRITYFNCDAVDTVSFGFGAHSGVEEIVMNTCRAYSTGFGEASGGFSVRSARANVTNCTARRVATTGLYIRNNSTRATQWVVANNRFYTCGTNGLRALVTLPVTPAVAGDTDAVAITGNTAVGCGENGIIVEGSSGTAGHFTRVAITGNTVRNTTLTGVYLHLLDEFTFTGNVVAEGTGGVKIEDCTGGTVTGNTLTAKTAGANWGIWLTGVTTNVTVGDNRVKGFSVGLVSDSNTVDCVFAANNLGGCTTPTNIVGTGHRVRDNIPFVMPTRAAAATVTLPANRQHGVAITAGGTTIATITAERDGDEVSLFFTVTTATVKHNTGNIKLNGSVDLVPTVGTVLTLFSRSSVWYEKARSVV